MSTDPFANFPGGNPFGGKNPFDGSPFDNMDDWLRSMGVDPKEFRDLFEDMQRNLHEAFKNMGQDPSKGFMAGFNVKMGPDGKPRIDTFGNKPKVNTETKIPTIKDDGREPLTDVIEDPKSIAITMEVPGVDKKDLDLNMTEDHLEVSVDNDTRKYHKRVKLPAKVDPATPKATYSNGILDVVVQKLEQANQGVKISVE